MPQIVDSPIAEEYDPVNHMTVSAKTLTLRGREYTNIPKKFADELVKQIKTDHIYEDIVEVNGSYFMPTEKYDVYTKLAKVLSSVKF